jgi:hypothetical protein
MGFSLQRAEFARHQSSNPALAARLSWSQGRAIACLT